MTTTDTSLSKELDESLRSVIHVLVDGQEGFQKLGDHLKDEKLKRYFFAESLKRASFRGDLETILNPNGIRDSDESGTVAAPFTASGAI